MRLGLILSAIFVLVVSKFEIPPFEYKENYCPCGVVDGKVEGWDPKQIWMDIFIIFDTSASMADELEEAKSMVTSFVSLMSTNRSADFFSRIGIISASDKIQVIYPLNMNSTDNLDEVKLSKAEHPNFEEAMKVANAMLPYVFRQNIIYYLTKNVPLDELELQEQGKDTPLRNFKRNGGIFMINDFGKVPNSELRILATPTYYFTDMSKNYVNNLAVLCEANCYCDEDDNFMSFNNYEWSIRTRANRGCFQFLRDKSQADARDYCQTKQSYAPGALVSIHDTDKNLFVNSAAFDSIGTKKKYWIGLEFNGTAWNWDDKSNNSYSSWATGQPVTSEGTSKCVYAQQGSGFNVDWYAEDCVQILNYMCEVYPFSVGNYGVDHGIMPP